MRMAAAKEMEKIIAAGGASARVLAAALGASASGASRLAVAAMVAAAWREKSAAADFQGDEISQRTAVVEAGLRVQSALSDGGPIKPLRTAIQALRALNRAVGDAKHERLEHGEARWVARESKAFAQEAPSTLHEKDLKVQTEPLAVQGLRHDSVALHDKDFNELRTELLAVRDDVKALREMDVKSLQEEVKVLRAELEGRRHDSVALHEEDKALKTELLAVQAELEGLRHDSQMNVDDRQALKTELLAVQAELAC